MKVIYRSPKKSDLGGLLAFVNELAEEGTYVAAEKHTRAEERKWLDGVFLRIRKKDEVMVVAEADGKIIGNCGIRRREARKMMRHTGIFGISVLKKYRGRGIGETLTRKVLAQAKKEMGLRLVILSALANNPVAPDLYKKMGFREYGRLPKAFLFKGKYIGEIGMFREL